MRWALNFILDLPFVCDGRSPDHIQCATTAAEANGQIAAVVGGQLTAAENLAVRAHADAVGLACTSVCAAAEESAVYKAFLDAGFKITRQQSGVHIAAANLSLETPKKSWWKFWR